MSAGQIAPTAGLDFHPGLRVAYVEYCKLPVGQGRLTYDPNTPKLSQSQFIKLLQHVAVCEPEGPVPLSTVTIIFSSFKPLGGSRMLFPHFFRALGALGVEANMDVLRLVANLGSRTADLQYLTSIKVFPDKAYPYILTRGGTGAADEIGIGSDGGESKRPVWSAQAPAATTGLQATHLSRYASQPFAGQGTVAPAPPSGKSNTGGTRWASARDGRVSEGASPRSSAPREVVQQVLRQSVASQGGNEAGGRAPGPDSPNNIGVVVYHVGLNGTTGPASPRQQPYVGTAPPMLPGNRELFEDSSAHPPNHQHMEQWGLYDPSRTHEQNLPGLVNYLLKRLDKVESALEQVQADKQHAHEMVTHDQLGDRLAPLEAQVRIMQAAADSQEVLGARDVSPVTQALIDTLTNKQDGLAMQVEALSNQVDGVQTTQEQLTQSFKTATEDYGNQIVALQQALRRDISEVMDTVEGVSQRVATVATQAIPAQVIPTLEGGITELAKQILELQNLVEEHHVQNSQVEAQLSKRIKSVTDQTVVDRTQLQTTSDLVGQAFAAIEQVKGQLAVLEVPGAGATSHDTSELESKVAALQSQVKQVAKDVKASDKQLTARMDQLQLDCADSQEMLDLIKGLREEFSTRIEHTEQQQVASLEHSATDMQALRDELAEHKVDLGKEIQLVFAAQKDIGKRLDQVDKGLAAAAGASKSADSSQVLELVHATKQELLERIQQVEKQQPDNSELLELVQTARNELAQQVGEVDGKRGASEADLLQLIKEMKKDLEGKIDTGVSGVTKKVSKQEKQVAECMARVEALGVTQKEQSAQAAQQAESLTRSAAVAVSDAALDELKVFKQETLDRLSLIEEQLSASDTAALAETITAVHEELLATQGRMSNAKAEVEEQIRELEQQVYSQPSPSSNGPSSEVLERHVKEMKQQVKTVEDGANTKISEAMEQLQALQQQMTKYQEQFDESKEYKTSTNSMLEQLMASFESLKPDLESASKEITEVKKDVKALSEQFQSKVSSKDSAVSEEAVKRLEDLAVRVDVAHDNLKDMRSVIDELSSQIEEHTYSIASAIRAHRQSEIRNNEESLTERAAVSAEQAAEAAEAAFDLASALEDKMNLLNRLVRATNAAMTSLEATQLDAMQRLATLESKPEGAPASVGTRGSILSQRDSLTSAQAEEAERVLFKTTDDLLQRVGDLEASVQQMTVKMKHGGAGRRASLVTSADQLGAAAITPEAWVAAQENLQTLAAKLGNMEKAAQAAQEAADEVMKIKVSFQGLQDLLDEHSENLISLHNADANLLVAINQIRGTGLSEKMKLLNVQGMDDTVASQAELNALTVKVQAMEDTLLGTLGRIDTSIAQAALQGWQANAAMLQRAATMQRTPGSPGNLRMAESARFNPPQSAVGDPSKYITAVDGNIAGGTNTSALKALNPGRDKLAAAILETDQRVTGIDEMVRAMKATQDTQKQRIKELAEALVALSNKAQSRFTKLESMRREDNSDEASKSGKMNASGVSPALKNLDQASSQMTGMHRLLAKRLDDVEERLTKAEAKGRSTRTESVGSGLAPPPSAVPHSNIEEDVKGIGQDIVALHSMIQRTEAELRQAITQECVSRHEVLALQQSLETNLAQKEDLIIKIAAQMDAVTRQLK